MSKLIRKAYASQTKALDESRSLIVTISTANPDRMGDVVMPQGAQLDNYLKNPIVLFGHNYGAPAVAKAEELHVTDEAIMAKVTFPDPGISSLADELYGLYKGGFMNAWSIGFSAKSKDMQSLADGGFKYDSWELMEFSAVPVPANAEALTVMRSKGLEPDVEEEPEDESEAEEAAEEEAVEAVSEPDIEQTVEEVIPSSDGTSVELHFTDGTTKTYKAALAKEPEPVGVPLTIETLKQVDQIIGRALRDLKQRNTSKQV